MTIVNYSHFVLDKIDCLKAFLYNLRRAIRFQYPAFFSILILKIFVRNPKSFNGKILYKIANDRSPHLTLFADKLKVRDYVEEAIGNEYLTRIYAKFSNPQEITLVNAPQNFVFKPNHVSGAALIVADFVPESDKDVYLSQRYLKKYYINPSSINSKNIHKLADYWLNMNYYGYHRSGFPEWAYRNITPNVYIEELLTVSGKPPEDFRFFTFGGKCQVIMVDAPGYIGVQRDIYTPDWEAIEVSLRYTNSKIKREKPIDLKKMVELAEKLAHGTDHLRVDFYNVEGRIVFGELTNYHAGGTQRFNPKSFDMELGKNWFPAKLY